MSRRGKTQVRHNIQEAGLSPGPNWYQLKSSLRAWLSCGEPQAAGFTPSAQPHIVSGPSFQTPRGPATCAGVASVSPGLEPPAPREATSVESKAVLGPSVLRQHQALCPAFVCPREHPAGCFTKGLIRVTQLPNKCLSWALMPDAPYLEHSRHLLDP